LGTDIVPLTSQPDSCDLQEVIHAVLFSMFIVIAPLLAIQCDPSGRHLLLKCLLAHI